MKASKKVLRVVELGILQEIKARDFYRSIASQLADKGANLKLDIMADTEEEHRKILTDWYKHLVGHEPDISEAKKKEAKRLIKTPPKDSTIKDVVKVICEAEERAYNFYKTAGEKTEDPDSRKVFEKLARMEKSHEEFFRDEYNTLVEDASIRFGDEEIPWLIEAME